MNVCRGGGGGADTHKMGFRRDGLRLLFGLLHVLFFMAFTMRLARTCIPFWNFSKNALLSSSTWSQSSSNSSILVTLRFPFLSCFVVNDVYGTACDVHHVQWTSLNKNTYYVEQEYILPMLY